jgi:hypothetical protein
LTAKISQISRFPLKLSDKLAPSEPIHEVSKLSRDTSPSTSRLPEVETVATLNDEESEAYSASVSEKVGPSN